MKPRYCLGKGPAPRHVADFQQQGERGGFIVRDETGSDSKLEFDDSAELQSHIEMLISQRVPFSVGGMCPGPADALYYWFRERGVPVEYLEISWKGPDDWIIREIFEHATEWQEVSVGELLSNH